MKKFSLYFFIRSLQCPTISYTFWQKIISRLYAYVIHLQDNNYLRNCIRQSKIKPIEMLNIIIKSKLYHKFMMSTSLLDITYTDTHFNKKY